MINGILNVYKEQEYTSFDVVARLRGILGQKKIGHTGTLDPMAEGVLIVCLGSATKLVDMITSGDKEYRATMKLGITTDTEDITGNVLETKNIRDDIDESRIKDTVKAFEGTYDQIPPMYSAIKKNGRKLYEYARQGIDIERTPRRVQIYSISDIETDRDTVSFLVRCSKGTYIRSLCRDIGEKLGCGAAMSKLVREQVHGFRSADAYTLSQISDMRDSGALTDKIIAVDALLREYPALYLKPEYEKALINGNKLKPLCFGIKEDVAYRGLVRVYNGDKFTALYTYMPDEKIYKPYKMFLG